MLIQFNDFSQCNTTLTDTYVANYKWTPNGRRTCKQHTGV